jgi:two-component system, cell cycle response regulator DivK
VNLHFDSSPTPELPHADHRLILIYQLAQIGPFEIHEARDGQQALMVIAATPPDLVFMNLGLPLLDGWESIRRIRELAPPLGQVPVIAYTAYAGGREEQRAREAGCSEYLIKPVRDWGVLQQIVTTLLASSLRP